METDASQSHAGKKINSYSTELKLEAIRFAVECNSNYYHDPYGLTCLALAGPEKANGPTRKAYGPATAARCQN